jgi:uracil-DNA glycosylase
MQVIKLHHEYDRLQKKYGSFKLNSIYGAGCIKNPDVCFVFMNPTAKNIASMPEWKGIRAQWLGTKNTWSMFHKLGLISKKTADKIKLMKPIDWTPEFAEKLYGEVADNKLFITNLGKCTMDDASHLPDKVFKEYLELLNQEIAEIKPKKIITFGNQVSSIFLGQPIKVSEWRKKSTTKTISGKKYSVYPVYYPVGQGMRNLPIAIEDIIFAMNG